MYSRYDNRPQRPIKLPENYSGVAFSERKGASIPDAPIAARPIDVAKPSPPAEKPTLQEKPLPHAPISAQPKISNPPDEPSEKETAAEKPSEKETLPTALPILFPNTLGHSILPHGIGFEELLLIGLIILLSHGEGDRNIILWLALLLFCG